LLALSYRTSIVPGRCIGAPTLTAGTVSVPIIEPNGAAWLLVTSATDLGHVERLPLEHPCSGPYQLPLSDATRAIWLGTTGILSYRPATVGTANRCDFSKWPADVTPEFQFGSPYLSNTGRLWQLCLDQRAERFEYVQIGSPDSRRPDIHGVDGPRFCTGQVSYHLETQSRADPWLDAGAEDAQMDEVVLPILESMGSSTVMCLRVQFVGSLSDFFAARDPQIATLEVTGEPGVRLYVVRVRSPWLASVFVYDGAVYLYHPDLPDAIPGWKLARQ
jgi:hypothetical protein